MDKPAKNTGRLIGIAVGSLIALSFGTAFAFVAHNNSQQYKNCIAQSDVTSDQCSLLYPAQR